MLTVYSMLGFLEFCFILITYIDRKYRMQYSHFRTIMESHPIFHILWIMVDLGFNLATAALTAVALIKLSWIIIVPMFFILLIFVLIIGSLIHLFFITSQERYEKVAYYIFFVTSTLKLIAALLFVFFINYYLLTS